mmetsp:Transcript_15974/g.50075  ORF Transcript_15974/g.50075 Transcript_15974/m.50075 type:complete len:164 (+) Transcript_15974:32-523(+)
MFISWAYRVAGNVERTRRIHRVAAQLAVLNAIVFALSAFIGQELPDAQVFGYTADWLRATLSPGYVVLAVLDMVSFVPTYTVLLLALLLRHAPSLSTLPFLVVAADFTETSIQAYLALNDDHVNYVSLAAISSLAVRVKYLGLAASFFVVALGAGRPRRRRAL